MIRKYNKINRIGDEHIYSLKDFVIFEDRWIIEGDKILVDDNGEEYNVLEYKVIKEDVLVCPEVMPYLNGWRKVTRTAIKLDKLIPKSITRFYVKPKYDYIYQ